MNTESHSNTSGFLWWVADLIQAGLKQSQCGLIILAFTLLRCLEFVLERVLQTTLKKAKQEQRKHDKKAACDAYGPDPIL